MTSVWTNSPADSITHIICFYPFVYRLKCFSRTDLSAYIRIKNILILFHLMKQKKLTAILYLRLNQPLNQPKNCNKLIFCNNKNYFWVHKYGTIYFTFVWYWNIILFWDIAANIYIFFRLESIAIFFSLKILQKIFYILKPTSCEYF